MYIDDLPYEILFHIVHYLDIKDMSNMLPLNKYLYNTINASKWALIDSMENRGLYIPSNVSTYEEYIYCVDWSEYVMKNIKIPEYVIDNLGTRLSFSLITTNQKLSEYLIRKYFLHIPLYNLLQHQKVPVEILDVLLSLYIFNDEEWRMLWKNQPITLHFMQKYEIFIDWHAISENKDAITLDILRHYGERFVWPEITRLGLHEEIIEAFIHKMNLFSWINVSYYSRLSPEFIAKYYQCLNILAIFTSQCLSEDLIYFLLKNSDSGDHYQYWHKIAMNQKLSRSFIEQNKDNLYLASMISNSRIKRADLKIIYG